MMNNMRKWIDLIERVEQHPTKEFLECLKRYQTFMLSAAEDIIVYRMHASWGERIMHVFDREMPRLDKSYTVYRGIHINNIKKIDQKFQDFNAFENDVISSGPTGYLSTSLQKPVAQQFANAAATQWNNWNDENSEKTNIFVVFIIKTMPGVRGIVVNDYSDYLADSHEIILNRNSKFKVINRERKPLEEFQVDYPSWQDTTGAKPPKDMRKLKYYEITLEQIA